jgi:hypothetical protein
MPQLVLELTGMMGSHPRGAAPWLLHLLIGLSSLSGISCNGNCRMRSARKQRRSPARAWRSA